MIIERAMSPVYLSNTYLVGDAPGGTAVLVDSGGPLEPILEKIYTIWGSTDLANWQELDDGLTGDVDATTYLDSRDLSASPVQYYFIEES